MPMKNIFSIDVEDWFHILDLPNAPDVAEWSAKESRVEDNLNQILDVLDEKNIKATLFVLGWVGEHYPELIRSAHRRGHEIASHGYAHQLVYGMTPEAFYEDVVKAKNILESITGTPVLGYRAPGFSITPETPWAFEMLVKAGYKYDSSIFPTERAHGGYAGADVNPHKIQTAAGELLEFPISVAPLGPSTFCFFGGGYFRLFPWFMIKNRSRLLNKAGRPVIYYLHPREIDPTHPRMPMSAVRRFKSYVNLHGTKAKLQKLVHDQELVSFQSWMKNAPEFSALLAS
ncbi:MAG: hypothetical protein RLZZ370_559 [Bacteroidota bacterium]